MQLSKNITTMAECTTTTTHLYFAFVRTGQFQLLSLTYQGQFTTVRLRSMGIFMASMRMFFGWQGQSVALTQPLETWIGNTSTNHPWTYFVLWQQHIKRGNLIYGKRQATSAQQTAEWGMHMIQILFLQIKDCFVYKERGERRICLKMLVLMYNMCARMVGINQIRNMNHLEQNANTDVFFWLSVLHSPPGHGRSHWKEGRGDLKTN